MKLRNTHENYPLNTVSRSKHLTKDVMMNHIMLTQKYGSVINSALIAGILKYKVEGK